MKISLVIVFSMLFMGVFGQHETFIEQLDSYLQTKKSDDFGLSIAISKDDKLIYSAAYGLANRAFSIPNSTQTKFNVGSMSKMLTAVSILQLMEEKKLALHEPISTYTDFFDNGYGDKITTHQLLTHTAGLPLWFYPTFDMDFKGRDVTTMDYLNLFDQDDVDASQIDTFRYSNVGYFVLGHMIEKLSGLTYKAYINTAIIEKIALKNTGFYHVMEIKPETAIGYVRPNNIADVWKDNSYVNLASSPAGGLYMSPEDMVEFYLALASSRLLSEKSWELMQKRHVERGDSHYGYGLQLEEVNEAARMGHGGSYYGVRAELMHYIHGAYTIALGANSDQTDYIDVSKYIELLLTGSEEDKLRFENSRKLVGEIITENFRYSISNAPELYEADWLEIDGYYYLNRNELDKAIKIFSFASEVYPLKNASWMNLYKAQNRKGDIAGSLKTMKAFSRLNPENGYAKRRIEELKNELKGCAIPE